MFELVGKFNTAKIFTDIVDQAGISQVQNLLNQEFVAGSTIRMMPDIHAGVGCSVGTTMTITDKVVPSLVGIDIGCGMEVARIDECDFDPAELDRAVRARIPSGFGKRSNPHRFFKMTRIRDLLCKTYINYSLAEASFGSLGGGNHFIEAGRDESELNCYLIIHSGSRHLGIEVEKYYRNKAVEQMRGLDPPSVQSFIKSLKKDGRHKEIEAELKRYFNECKGKHIIPELAYVSGYLLHDYLHDMRIVQEYAEWSRRAMMDEIVSAMGFEIRERFSTIHNYIDTDNLILRKGAVSAQEGEKLIIPINMRDGSLICRGKGNPDWNFSAPHGAGRLFSRADAKAKLSLDDYRRQMREVYSTSVCEATLDESPMAYKGMDDIVNNISPTVEILHVVKPFYNFKAGNE